MFLWRTTARVLGLGIGPHLIIVVVLVLPVSRPVEFLAHAVGAAREHHLRGVVATILATIDTEA